MTYSRIIRIGEGDALLLKLLLELLLCFPGLDAKSRLRQGCAFSGFRFGLTINCDGATRAGKHSAQQALARSSDNRRTGAGLARRAVDDNSRREDANVARVSVL